jgi:hypothetical protein
MSQKPKTSLDEDLLPEYDFTGAVRGKHYERYRQGTSVVLLDPDVAVAFGNSAAVNDALRLLVSLAKSKVARPRNEVQQQEGPNELRILVARSRDKILG